MKRYGIVSQNSHHYSLRRKIVIFHTWGDKVAQSDHEIFKVSCAIVEDSIDGSVHEIPPSDLRFLSDQEIMEAGLDPIQ